MVIAHVKLVIQLGTLSLLLAGSFWLESEIQNAKSSCQKQLMN